MKFILGLAASMLVFASGALAEPDSLPLKPGMWEMTTRVTMPGLAEPMTNTSVECMKQDRFDPMTQMEMGADCQLVEQTLQGNTLSWRMSCRIEGQPAEVDGQFTYAEGIGEGWMTMQTMAGGQPVTIRSEWRARHTGKDC